MAQTVHIEDLEDQSFDPYIADDQMFGTTEDPYSILADFGAAAPVVEESISQAIGMPSMPIAGYDHVYSVLSYAGVEQVLNDPVTFSNQPLRLLLSNYGPLLSGMDPPEHTRYRRVLQKAFRPPVVQEWAETVIAPVVGDLISSLPRSGGAELVEEFCRPIPFRVIYRLLALPPEDVEIFYKLTMAQIATSNAAEASEKLGRYFSRLLEERRESPGRDLISVVAALEDEGEPLPEDVAVAFFLQLMSAGGETTFRTMTVLLTALLTGEQLHLVRDDRSLVPQAVEEALRWDGPVVTTPRRTTVDTVVDGVPVPANSLLYLAYGAANRDPAVFAEPDRFDVLRAHHRHFAFAFGAHNCLGQLLARMELFHALNAILDRLPHLRLDPDQPRPILRGATMRTPRQLHVVYGG